MPIVAVDNFKDFRHAPPGPFPHGVAVAPSDTDELPEVTNAIDVAVAGNIECVFANDTVAVVLPASVGQHNWRLRQIKASLTTAGGIVALY